MHFANSIYDICSNIYFYLLIFPVIENAPETDEMDEMGNKVKGEPAPLTSAQVSNLIATVTSTKEVSQSVILKHRELHSLISKVGKATDKVSNMILSTYLMIKKNYNLLLYFVMIRINYLKY